MLYLRCFTPSPNLRAEPCDEGSVLFLFGTPGDLLAWSYKQAPGGYAAKPALRPAYLRNLVQQFRLRHRLPDLCAAVGAFKGEVDFRHAPTRRDVLDIHRQARTAWAGHEGWLGIVTVDVGWHVGSPQQGIQLWSPTPKPEGAPATVNRTLTDVPH